MLANLGCKKRRGSGAVLKNVRRRFSPTFPKTELRCLTHGFPLFADNDYYTPGVEREIHFFPSITTAVEKPAAFGAYQQEFNESESNKALSPAKA